jgi:site-specific DNA recombinase
MTLRAAIYVRVSSEEQADGHSLDEQLYQCREFCKRRDMAVEVEYIEVESAKNVTDRDQFQTMIQDAEAGRFAVIVTHKLDRFSRDVVDGLTVLKGLARYGVAFISATEDFDFSTPMGEVMLTLLLAFARMYRRNLIGETTKGKQGRARKGISNATRPPFGYTRDASGHDVPDAEADTAREMFERYATGDYSDFQIAEWLNAQGKVTCGTWGSQPFSKDTVRAMLMNPFYCGDVRYRGLVDRENEHRERMRRSKRETKVIQGVHEALISRELFEKCQAVRAARGHSYAGRKPAHSRVYLLSRVTHCAHCGGPLRALTMNGGVKYYRCTAKERGTKCGATYRVIQEDVLLDDLAHIMARLQLPDDIKAQATALITADDPTAAIEKQRGRLEAELQRVNRMYQAGNLADDYYDAEVKRIKGELARLATPVHHTDTQAAIEALGDMTRLWQNATPEEQADIVSCIFEQVEVDLDTKRIVGVVPKNEYAALCMAAFGDKAISGRDGIQRRARRLDGYRSRPFNRMFGTV